MSLLPDVSHYLSNEPNVFEVKEMKLQLATSIYGAQRLLDVKPRVMDALVCQLA